jgi:predicted nucleotide-binding protein (sugar kinase/HSP70/actin superfamily)
VLLNHLGKEDIDEGLKFVHNDACFPAVCVIGQLMKAVNSGKYNLNQLTIALFQTGGCCRATNYIAFMKKALKDNGTPQIPVLSLNFYGMDKHPGFSLSPGLFLRSAMAVVYGDLFTILLPRVRPYELIPGAANSLHKEMIKKAKEQLRKGSLSSFRKTCAAIISAFEEFPLNEGEGEGEGRKPRVGIVGEILVKVHDDANNNIIKFLESEGAETSWHGLLDFFSYCAFDNITRFRQLSGKGWMAHASNLFIDTIECLRRDAALILKHSLRFHSPDSIIDLAARTEKFISLCNQAGEGWYLVGEMLSLINQGVDNILILQPFGCLPNHITGRGMMRLLRDSFPTVNIAAIDYDPGASQVNQINRVKLMLAVAKKSRYGKNYESNGWGKGKTSPFASSALLVPKNCPRTTVPSISSQSSLSSSQSPSLSPTLVHPTPAKRTLSPVGSLKSGVGGSGSGSGGGGGGSRSRSRSRGQYFSSSSSSSSFSSPNTIADVEDLVSNVGSVSVMSSKQEFSSSSSPSSPLSPLSELVGCTSLCSSCSNNCDERLESASTSFLHNADDDEQEGLHHRVALDPNGLACAATEQHDRLSHWYVRMLFIIVFEVIAFVYSIKLFNKDHPNAKRAIFLSLALLFGTFFYYSRI